MSNVEERLINDFGDMFPGYRIEKLDEGYKLLRVDGIQTEDGKEDVWVATVYEMAELFSFLEYNRQIVNDRNEQS